MFTITRRLTGIVLSACALALVAAPLQAQRAELPVGAGEAWEHDWTDMVFPARIGSFTRDRVIQLEERQSSVAGSYSHDASGSILTLYIYRPGKPSTAIWFDRMLVAILGRGGDFGAVDRNDLKIGSFVPTGGSAPSGHYAVSAVDGRFRSTAAALYRAGDWLVKLRISSRGLDLAEMERLAKDTLAGLPPLAGIPASPAYFIEDCEEPLATERASLVEIGSDNAAAIALEASMVPVQAFLDSRKGGQAGAPTYCRAARSARQFTPYRPVGDASRYVLALSDAGQHIEVFPSKPLTSLAGGSDGRAVYQVMFVGAMESVVHVPTLGLPGFDIVNASLGKTPLAKVSRPLGEQSPDITILAGKERAGE